MESSSFEGFLVFADDVLRRCVTLCSRGDYDLDAADAALSQTDVIHRIATDFELNLPITERPNLEETVREIEVQRHNLNLMIDQPEIRHFTIGSPDAVFTGGRPKYDIAAKAILDLKQEGFTSKDIALILRVSERTIKSRCQKFGLNKKDMASQVEDCQLDDMVRNICGEFASVGYRMVCARLLAGGYFITRYRVRQSMHRVDPTGVAQRFSQLIPRRKYKVAGPNALWHLDGCLKLVKYGFVEHGGIDGWSRLLVYLVVNTNNKATTVFQAFNGAVQQYNVPSRVRTDHGGENLLVGEWMEVNCGTNRGSFITGKFVHNQRIERFWRDLREAVLDLYRALFQQMETEGMLDITNKSHILILQHVFLPRLRHSVESYQVAWNSHKIRTEKSRTPRQLFIKGAATVGLHGHAAPEPTSYENYGIDDDGPIEVQEEDIRGLPEIDLPTEAEHLVRYLDPLVDDGNHGKSLFMQGRMLLSV